METGNTIKGYLLYRIYYSAPGGDYIAYLGRTKQSLASRLRGHFFQKPMHRTINIHGVSKIEYASFTTEADMNLYEIYYILTLHPPLNVDDKTKDYPTVKLPEVVWTEWQPPLMEKWKAEINERDTACAARRKRIMAIDEDLRVLRSLKRVGELTEDEYWERHDALVEEREKLK